jgi:hypothetical protein
VQDEDERNPKLPEMIERGQRAANETRIFLNDWQRRDKAKCPRARTKRGGQESGESAAA